MKKRIVKQLAAVALVLCMLVSMTGCVGVGALLGIFGLNVTQKNESTEVLRPNTGGSASGSVDRDEPADPEPEPEPEPAPELTVEQAKELIAIWNTYWNYGTCNQREKVSEEDRTAILKGLGYPEESFEYYYPWLITCCEAKGQMREHLRQYIGQGLLSSVTEHSCITKQYQGKIYQIVTEAVYDTFYLQHDLVPQADGTVVAELNQAWADQEQTWTAVFALEDGQWKLMALEGFNDTDK